MEQLLISNQIRAVQENIREGVVMKWESEIFIFLEGSVKGGGNDQDFLHHIFSELTL